MSFVDVPFAILRNPTGAGRHRSIFSKDFLKSSQKTSDGNLRQDLHGVDTCGSDDEPVSQRTVNREMTSERDHNLLLLCRTYSSDPSSFWCSRFGHHAFDSMSTCCSFSRLPSTTMRWLRESATNNRPSLSADRCQGQLTSVNVASTVPVTSTSHT